MKVRKDIFKEIHSSTVLDYRRRINIAMRFADENWDEQLDIHLIAKAVRYSPYHFHRIFGEFTGETLAGYIRKQRMRNSARMLVAGVPVADVAIASGFWTASAFSRSFKQPTGVTPSQFQRLYGNAPLIFPAPVSLQRMSNPALIPRIIEDKAFTLYYLPKKIANEGLLSEHIGRAFYEAFDKWFIILKKYHLEAAVLKRLGVIRGVTSVYQPNCAYDAGIVFNREVMLNGLDEIRCTCISAGRWAVFLHTGPYNTLWQTWNYIYNYWRWVSGYHIRADEAYEVYLNNQRNTPQDELLTELYIPVD
ncbi:MAG: AraC family transcriptional regulator [Parafilimonas sp.]